MRSNHKLSSFRENNFSFQKVFNFFVDRQCLKKSIKT